MNKPGPAPRPYGKSSQKKSNKSSSTTSLPFEPGRLIRPDSKTTVLLSTEDWPTGGVSLGSSSCKMISLRRAGYIWCCYESQWNGGTPHASYLSSVLVVLVMASSMTRMPSRARTCCSTAQNNSVKCSSCPTASFKSFRNSRLKDRSHPRRVNCTGTRTCAILVTTCFKNKRQKVAPFEPSRLIRPASKTTGRLSTEDWPTGVSLRSSSCKMISLSRGYIL
jgi:hypothetical protein